MAGVFINYRRDDSKSEAGRLFDWLSRYFGKDQVFMDVAGSIEPGLEFDRVIEKAVASCDVLIVVIGRAWLTVADEKGKLRLDDPNDFVHMEIAAALSRDIRVIPVLVQGAAMPDEDKLPEDLKRLCKRQASEISDNRWEFDTEQLVKVLDKAGVKPRPGQTVVPDEHPVPAPPAAKKFSKKAVAGIVVAILAAVESAMSIHDRNSQIGWLIMSLAALGLGIAAYYDAKQGKVKGQGLAIAGMALAGILTLVFIGELSTSEPSVPQVVYDTLPYSPPAPASFVDISGSWRGRDGIYVFQQSGNSVNVQVFDLNQALVAQGTGMVAEGVVSIAYYRIDNTGGEATLKVSADGRQMTGNYTNLVTGEAGSMVLAR